MVNKFRSYADYRENCELESLEKNLQEALSPSLIVTANIGYEQGVFLSSFISPLKEVGMKDEMLANILLSKMNLEYTQEIMRMRYETEERIAQLYAENQPNFVIGTSEN